MIWQPSCGCFPPVTGMVAITVVEATTFTPSGLQWPSIYRTSSQACGGISAIHAVHVRGQLIIASLKEAFDSARNAEVVEQPLVAVSAALGVGAATGTVVTFGGGLWTGR